MIATIILLVKSKLSQVLQDNCMNWWAGVSSHFCLSELTHVREVVITATETHTHIYIFNTKHVNSMYFILPVAITDQKCVD